MKLDPNTTALLNQMGFDAGTIESWISGMILLTVVAVIAAIPTGIIAKRKRRSPALWLLFALTIPVLPLLLVWLLPEAPEAGPPPEK